jgi:hypothetical protein
MNETYRQVQDAALMSAARAELERQAAALDEFSAARLRAARRRALEEMTWPGRSFGWRPVVAVSVVLTLLVLPLMLRAPAPADDPLGLMSTMDDNDELYENLDFYQWLEERGDEKPV